MKKLIFVSCGQQSDEERKLGLSVKALVDANPEFEAYFAQSVQSLDSLSQNIFEAVAKCSGTIIFLHDRGKAFEISGKEWGNRSSVWVNQEIAILAFRQYIEAQRVPILVFKDEKVRLEGAMTDFIINPYLLRNTSEVLRKVEEWLKESHFLLALDEEFGKKWKLLSDLSKQLLSCLIDLGGVRVKEDEIRNCLISKYLLSNNDATKAIKKARLEFQETNLVEFEINKEAIYEFTMHPTWTFHLRRALAKWHASEGGCS